jgi:hypothetical protein
MGGSGKWPDVLREGYALVLFLGLRKDGVDRHTIGGPAHREAVRWKLAHLEAPVII